MRLTKNKYLKYLFGVGLRSTLYKYVDYVILRNKFTEVYLHKKNVNIAIQLMKLRGDLQFKILGDVVITDNLTESLRFKVSYNLFSLFLNKRAILQSFVAEMELMATVSKLFASADWFEREAWDLYGVQFVNHTDLRRILTDYGFKGYPLRKDFPLTGYIELRYDDLRGDIVYEPVELSQELRFFNFSTGWEID